MRAAGPDPVDELAVTIRHFFPEMGGWLDEVRDPRKSGKPVYRMRVLLLGTLMFLGHTKSRNHMNDNARGASALARNLARLSGEQVVDVPHLDTIEKVLRRCDPAHIERVLSLMIRRLIRMKASARPEHPGCPRSRRSRRKKTCLSHAPHTRGVHARPGISSADSHQPLASAASPFSPFSEPLNQLRDQ